MQRKIWEENLVSFALSLFLLEAMIMMGECMLGWKWERNGRISDFALWRIFDFAP